MKLASNFQHDKRNFSRRAAGGRKGRRKGAKNIGVVVNCFIVLRASRRRIRMNGERGTGSNEVTDL